MPTQKKKLKSKSSSLKIYFSDKIWRYKIFKLKQLFLLLGNGKFYSICKKIPSTAV